MPAVVGNSNHVTRNKTWVIWDIFKQLELARVIAGLCGTSPYIQATGITMLTLPYRQGAAAKGRPTEGGDDIVASSAHNDFGVEEPRL